MIFKKKNNFLEQKIDILIDSLEQSNLRELSFVLGSKKQIFWRNTLAGIARGIGIGIGVTLITAVLIYILRQIVSLNIPVIGEYIADIVQIVERSR